MTKKARFSDAAEAFPGRPGIGRMIAVLLAAAAAAAYLALRLGLLRHRYFNIDEFEHLHAAWCIARGQVLYRDFFEHHGPLWYGLLQFVPRLFDDPFQALSAGRALAFLCWGAVLALQGYLCPSGWSIRDRALSVVLLASCTTFAHKSLEIRPDTLNAALTSLLLVLTLRPRGTIGRFMIGLLLGTAFFVSPKISFPAAGFVVGLLLQRRAKSDASSGALVRTLGPVVLGACVPTAGVAAYFWLHGALRDLVQWLFVFNLSFKPLQSAVTLAGKPIAENPLLWTTAVLGWATSRGSLPLRGAWAGAAANLFCSPHVFQSNYLYFAPLSAYFAADFLIRLSRDPEHFTVKHAAYAALAAGIAWPFWIQAASLKNTNRHQLDEIRCVQKYTAPDAAILGFRNIFSFWRPHAYFYWWLPNEHLKNFSPEITRKGILEAVSDSRCRAVLWDPDYFAEHPLIAEYVRKHYRPAGCGSLYLRSDG